jgi:hypothetical protein
MLRRFLYLDEQMLNDFISALEDGLRQSRTDSTGESGGKSIGGNAKVVSGQLDSARERSSSTAASDTGPARFSRLLTLAEEAPEASGWADVVTLDDLATAGRGAFVDFECELQIPDFARLTDSRELGGFLDLIESFSSLGPLLGNAEGMPSADEISGVRSFANMMKGSGLIVVGEDDDSDWRCAGNLKRDLVRGSLDELPDYFRVTGKVGRPIKAGERKPLLALPGMSVLSRDERRALERKKPSPGEEDMYLEGPACMIDVLAIYR